MTRTVFTFIIIVIGISFTITVLNIKALSPSLAPKDDISIEEPAAKRPAVGSQSASERSAKTAADTAQYTKKPVDPPKSKPVTTNVTCEEYFKQVKFSDSYTTDFQLKKEGRVGGLDYIQRLHARGCAGRSPEECGLLFEKCAVPGFCKQWLNHPVNGRYRYFADGFSQDGQDRFLLANVFPTKLDGVFIDIGAADGLRGSNSAFLEQCLGWSGACAEANPWHFHLLKHAPRRCTRVHAAIGYDGIANFTDAGTLSGITTEYDPRHWKRMTDELGREPKVHKIKAMSFPTLLKATGLEKTTIDYLHLDVEGAELKILKTVDWKNGPLIKVLSVENNFRENKFRDYLTPLGYEMIGYTYPDEFWGKKGIKYDE